MQFALWMALILGAAGPTGDIAYVAGAGKASAQVCVLDIASGTVAAVGSGDWDGAPQWSPDGAWLAFERGGGALRKVHVARPDGTEGEDLNHALPWNVSPRWSTDGTRLAYTTSPGPDGLGSIAVYDLNTGEERIWGGGRAGLLRPVWMPYSELMLMLSPDVPLKVPGVDMERFLGEARMGGLSILSGALPEAVFAVQLLPGGGRNSGLGTSAVLATESEVLPFLEVAEVDEVVPDERVLWQVEPSWEGAEHDFSSSTGKRFGAFDFAKKGKATRIAYESEEGGDREIYVLWARGRSNVTNHRAADWNPVWSPGGRRLAFESFRDGRRGIYQVFTDTALVSPVATGEGGSWSPAWSPTGKWIAFISDRAGEDGLYVVSDKGAELRRLSGGSAPLAAPAWRPTQP